MRADYDAGAAKYDEGPYPNDDQRAWVDRLLALCPDGGVVLDAPCGTGRYFEQIVGSGRRVVGVDQSMGMLTQARARGAASELHHVGLQELDFVDRFDAAMTVDAMENVAPEDWPLVLHVMRRALHDGAPWYLTVEEKPRGVLRAELASLRARGYPVVEGEVIGERAAGYHYYPTRGRVRGWLDAERLVQVDDATSVHDGWSYWHLLLRAA